MTGKMMPSTYEPPATSYDPRYFQHLFAAEEKHFWFLSRNAILQRMIVKLVKDQLEGYRLLEAGCGTGNVLRMLEQTCTTGLVAGMDLFSDGLRFARRRVNIPLIQGDMLHPPFKNGLDFVCMFDVLEHLSDDLGILLSVRTFMKKDGRLVLTVPADPRLWSYFDVASRHVRRYTRESLQLVIEQAGFKVDFISPYMMAIYPLVWLNRRLAGDLSGGGLETDEAVIDKKTTDELTIIPGLNRLLNWFLSIEGYFLAAGMKLPLGTSLLAVARRL